MSLKKVGKFTFDRESYCRRYLSNGKGKYCVLGQYFKKCGVDEEELEHRGFLDDTDVCRIFGVKPNSDEYYEIEKTLANIAGINDSHRSHRAKMPLLKKLFSKIGVRFRTKEGVYV